MTLDQLHIVKKIKFLAASRAMTKKEIVDEVKKNAMAHRVINQRQEREDGIRVDHAQKELAAENESVSEAYSHISTALAVSIFINFILLAALALTWYFVFYQ